MCILAHSIERMLCGAGASDRTWPIAALHHRLVFGQRIALSVAAHIDRGRKDAATMLRERSASRVE